jgi:hypothetical protein
MADIHHNSILSDLLVEQSRCLLQYVGECWPWMSGDDAERCSIDELVIRQQQGVGRLATLLDNRRQTIDFGTYPTEYTDLQYLAFSHLLGLLIKNQQALVNVFQHAATDSADDAQAATVIEEIHSAERDNLSHLQEIAAKQASNGAA